MKSNRFAQKPPKARRYIACQFCGIRNFTVASEAVESEDVISLLQNFLGRLGALMAARSGTMGYCAGDWIMVFFNDPGPCDPF